MPNPLGVQVPPEYAGPHNGVPTTFLPWQPLAEEFMDRNPHMIDNPLYMGPDGMDGGRLKSLSMAFGKRQWALIQKGQLALGGSNTCSDLRTLLIPLPWEMFGMLSALWGRGVEFPRRFLALCRLPACGVAAHITA